jgi:hypothetical protein
VPIIVSAMTVDVEFAVIEKQYGRCWEQMKRCRAGSMKENYLTTRSCGTALMAEAMGFLISAHASLRTSLETLSTTLKPKGSLLWVRKSG